MERFIVSLTGYLGLFPLSSRDEPSLRVRLDELELSFDSLLLALSLVCAGGVDGVTFTAGGGDDGAGALPPAGVDGCEYVGVEIGLLRSLSLFPSRVAPPVLGLFPSPDAGDPIVTAVGGGAHQGVTGLYGFGQ